MLLTRRQREILTMFLDGHTYREVASALGLSPETINPSLKQSAKRLGAPGIGREVLREAAERAGEWRAGGVGPTGDEKAGGGR